ncbi:MAG TPA: four helix bundle protein [Beijerinckiaceae bacterium]|nr:four helix bundle protein [Beijerinckiaceae bacterium]
MAIQSHRDLRVWNAAVELSVACYRLTADFPREEAYGLTSQIRRASVSIAANIAEGYGRDNVGSYIQFLRIAQGSLKELETLLLLAERIPLCDSRQIVPLTQQSDGIGRMLRSLIRTLQDPA